MITGQEISDTAKAVQEVAKAAKSGIETTEKVGNFFSRVFKGSIDEAAGILEDKLKVARFERQLRLVNRVEKILKEKGVEGEWKTVPPKLVIPILQNATWEEEDELQDLWARLLSSSLDPNYVGTNRTAFVDILKQLEVLDVHIFNYIYSEYNKANPNRRYDPARIKIGLHRIIATLNLDPIICRESLDNLLRVRIIAPAIESKKIEVPRKLQRRASINLGGTTHSPQLRGKLDSDEIALQITYAYEKLCMTPLGLSFAEACMVLSNVDE